MKFLSILLTCYLFLCSANPSSLLGQPRFPPAGDGVGHQGYGTNCSYNLRIQVPLTNLDLFSPDQGPAPYYYESIPDSYPDMYLELKYDGQTVKLPVENFILQDQPNNNFTLYIAEVIHPINYCSLCHHGGSGFHIYNFPIFLKLVTENDESYPACDYTATDDIFSCMYFENPVCNNRTGICDNVALTENEEKFIISCYSPEIQFDPVRGTIDNPDDDINIYPNPVSEDLSISIPEKFESGNLEIYNINGRPIHFSSEHSGNTTYRLNTSNFANGTYIIRVYEEDLVLYKRFVKI